MTGTRIHDFEGAIEDVLELHYCKAIGRALDSVTYPAGAYAFGYTDTVGALGLVEKIYAGYHKIKGGKKMDAIRIDGKLRPIIHSYNDICNNHGREYIITTNEDNVILMSRHVDVIDGVMKTTDWDTTVLMTIDHAVEEIIVLD